MCPDLKSLINSNFTLTLWRSGLSVCAHCDVTACALASPGSPSTHRDSKLVSATFLLLLMSSQVHQMRAASPVWFLLSRNTSHVSHAGDTATLFISIPASLVVWWCVFNQIINYFLQGQTFSASRVWNIFCVISQWTLWFIWVKPTSTTENPLVDLESAVLILLVCPMTVVAINTLFPHGPLWLENILMMPPLCSNTNK